MSGRIKLTAGGAQHVSELIRYRCPKCRRNHLIHPTRWKIHLIECLKDSTFADLMIMREREDNKVTKDFIENSMLHFHNSVQQ